MLASAAIAASAAIPPPGGDRVAFVRLEVCMSDAKEKKEKSKQKLHQLDPRLQGIVMEVEYTSEAEIKAMVTQFRKATDVLMNILSARNQYIKSKSPEGMDFVKEGDNESVSSKSKSTQ